MAVERGPSGVRTPGARDQRGKDIAAVVPIDDLRLLEELEDRIDLAEARAALAETKRKGAKSLNAILKDLNP